jgi:hypothetical protein
VEEVQRLDEEGLSKRDIAGRVFGDVRYYGRVERILRRPPSPPSPDVSDESLRRAAPRQESRAFIRELLERHRARLAMEELPSLKEIELLMKLERQLEVAEMVEQANALTREPRA